MTAASYRASYRFRSWVLLVVSSVAYIAVAVTVVPVPLRILLCGLFGGGIGLAFGWLRASRQVSRHRFGRH